MYEFVNFTDDVGKCFEPKALSSNTKFSVVIPVRGVERQNSLDICIWNFLRYGGSNIEIIVSEEDKTRKINLDKFKDNKNVKYIFQNSDDVFNKSRAINKGVAQSVNKIVIMNDVDILIPNNYFNAFHNLSDRYDFFFLGADLHYADCVDNKILYNGDSWLKHPDRYPYVGGNVAFTKAAFNRIGGMFEKFVGYGSEDGEFYSRAKAYNRHRFLEKRTLNLIHLNHEYIQENSKNVMKNWDLYQKMRKMSVHQRVKIVRCQGKGVNFF